MRALAPLAAVLLAGCSTQPTAQPAQGAHRPPSYAAPGCPRYGELRDAIDVARGEVEDQAKLDAAERVASAACDPRNRAARKKADRALRAVRELERAP
jgi:hypothetical protein